MTLGSGCRSAEGRSLGRGPVATPSYAKDGFSDDAFTSFYCIHLVTSPISIHLKVEGLCVKIKASFFSRFP